MPTNPAPGYPLRLQRMRVGGFSIQRVSKEANGLTHVCVTRPGMWGNPFRVIDDTIYCNVSERPMVVTKWEVFFKTNHPSRLRATEIAVCMFQELLRDPDMKLTAEYIVELPVPETVREAFRKMHLEAHKLRGKNLFCFCSPGSPCHADVLLEFANQ